MTNASRQGTLTGMTKKRLPPEVQQALALIANHAVFGSTNGYSAQDLGAEMAETIHETCGADMGRVAWELDTLSTCRSLAIGLMEQEVPLVRNAREAGATWEQVADVYCISRQAAWERFREAE